MRFAPAAAALSLIVAITASVGQGAERDADPRAAMLVTEGRAALEADQPQRAIDAFEAALAIDPGYTAIFLDLAQASRAEGMQGKAIHYYREALVRDPGNLAAISGEGAALVEKGALEKARANLSKLTSMCGAGCAETRQLAAAIEAGPRQPVLTAEALLPEAQVTQAN
ncbi:tetratricopeptide repeat protein [Pelagerythrobacter sp.]|uniref:tetratricopeptide repeat protein n=1 Tax=Pelagerythrobacter sp. TaxID=2800702 RepID=UPI0035AEE79E